MPYQYYKQPSSYGTLCRTPLSDTVYSNLLTSENHYGVLKGPAGTGKTETFKDFCKYVGRECVVVNTSDQFTLESFSQCLSEEFLSKGVCVTFDEFNRCPLELSV